MSRRTGPRKVTPTYLRNAALHYLDRYASSAGNLRRILLAKVERSARAHDTDRREGAAAVEALIAEFEGSGVLDDTRYADARSRAWHRRGASIRAIRNRLAAKGIAGEPIANALASLRETVEEPDLAAAVAFARRRRLGPYRAPEHRIAHRARDLAALGRQGFAYGLAKRVIEADDPAELEAEAADAGDTPTPALPHRGGGGSI